MKNKKVLVTGGAGYIGSHTIVELINSGYMVESVDNFSNSSEKVFQGIYKITGKKIKNYCVDLSNQIEVKKIFKNKKYDAIIHFAAYKAVGESVEKPIEYYKNNIGSLVNVIELAKTLKARYFIFSSSCAVYDQKEKLPYTEASRLAPSSPYGMTKMIGEQLLKDFTNNKKDISSLSLRYFNPGGAHKSLCIGEDPKGIPNNLIPVMCRAIKTRNPFSVFGNDYNTKDGTCVRDYIHVVDVAQAHVQALKYLFSKQLGFYDVFNIGTGKGVSVYEMINAFEKINNIKLPYLIKKRRSGDMPTVYASTKKCNKELKYKTKYNIKDITRSAWGWEMNNKK